MLHENDSSPTMPKGRDVSYYEKMTDVTGNMSFRIYQIQIWKKFLFHINLLQNSYQIPNYISDKNAALKTREMPDFE